MNPAVLKYNLYSLIYNLYRCSTVSIQGDLHDFKIHFDDILFFVIPLTTMV